MAQNRAAWLKTPESQVFEVDDAPIYKPGPTQILIKNHAVALNPVEWKIPAIEFVRKAMIPKFPFIIGADIAGVVEAVGQDVSRFTKGQRVFGLGLSMITGDSALGGFQNYTLMEQANAWEIPDHLSFVQSSVLPTAIVTAAMGLFSKADLALPLPSLTPSSPINRSILIWGGASSVGGAAIQLAVSSGLRVVSTASAHNHEYVRSLGAAEVFDYKSLTVTDDIYKALAGSDLVGVYDAVSEAPSLTLIAEILGRLETPNLHVCAVLPAPENLQKALSGLKSITALSILTDSYISEFLSAYIPVAVEGRRIQAKPEPLIVGTGIKSIQDGLMKLMGGVSAQKLVIEL